MTTQPTTQDDVRRRLGEIRARLLAATPGAWVVSTGAGYFILAGDDNGGVVAQVVRGRGNPMTDRDHGDAALVAAAPSDLAWLCDHLAPLLDAVEEGGGLVDWAYKRGKAEGLLEGAGGVRARAAHVAYHSRFDYGTTTLAVRGAICGAIQALPLAPDDAPAPPSPGPSILHGEAAP